MKLLKTIIGLAFGAGILFIITRIARSFDPNRSAIEAAKRQAEIERIEQITRWQGQALTASIVLIYVLIAGVLLFCVVFVIRLWKRNRQAMSDNYQRGGSFPLRRVKLPGGREILINPNNMVSSAIGIDPSLGAFEFNASAGWDRQLAKAQAAQGTHTFIAMAGAPRATAPMVKGAMGAKGYETAQPRIIGDPMASAAENGDMAGNFSASLDHLIGGAGPAALPFGFGRSGDLATWHAESTPHLRIHGATRKGKTSAAMSLVAVALSQGWHVIIVDPRRFKDWGVASPAAEMVDARSPAAFLGALESIHDEYLRREQLLSYKSVPDISALNGHAPARICVLIEEYGAQRLRARSAGTGDQVDQILGILSAEAAADGIHIVALDQRPDQYDKRVKANLAPVVFGLPSGAGQASGYARAHSLDPYHFYYDGLVWQSVDARADFPRIVRKIAPGRHAPIVDGVATTSTAAESGDTAAASSAAESGDTATPDATRREQFVIGWFASTPRGDQTQAELRRAMSQEFGKHPDAYKGHAHELYHRHKPTGPEIFQAGTEDAAELAEWLKANRNNVRVK